MKKIFNIKIPFLLLLFLWASCSEELSIDNKGRKSSSKEKTEIEEAKIYFEEQYPDAHMLNLTMGKLTSTRSASESFHSKSVEPVWKKAIITPYNQGTVIEFPTKMPGDIYALKRSIKQGVTSHERIRVQTRLVMYKDSKGNMSYRIATIIADKEYYKVHKDSLKKMSSLVEGTNFTGTVIHSFLNGKMAGGRYYVNGIPQYRLKFDSKKNSRIYHEHRELSEQKNSTRALKDKENIISAEEFSLSLTLIDRNLTPVSYMSSWENNTYCALCGSAYCDGNCNPIIIEPDRCSGCGEYESQCTCNDWGCIWCGSPYCYGECQSSSCSYCGKVSCNGECQDCSYCGSSSCDGECQSCSYCGDRNCNGECLSRCIYCGELSCNGECQNSGGNENENNDAGKSYVSQANDKMARKDIPAVFSNPQVGGTCVFASMQYVNNMLGGDVNYGAYIKGYMDKHGLEFKYIMENGMLSTHAHSFISSYFHVDTFTTFTTAIDNGYVVLTDISTSQKYTHCVTVVGYHPNGDLIYMNPETGLLEEWKLSKANITFATPVKKIK